LKTYIVAYYARMIERYIRQHWIESTSNCIAPTWDNRFRETSSYLFSLKLIYQNSYHWSQYMNSYTKIHIYHWCQKILYTKTSGTKVYISKFTSVNPIYQNSYIWTLYIHTMHAYHIYTIYNTKVNISKFIYITEVNFFHIPKCISLESIYQNSHL
jgi:hypothetical protein